MIAVAADPLRRSAVGGRPEVTVAEALDRWIGVTPWACIPDDPAAFDAAVLTGRPLCDAAPHSRATAAWGGLARSLGVALALPGHEAGWGCGRKTSWAGRPQARRAEGFLGSGGEPNRTAARPRRRLGRRAHHRHPHGGGPWAAADGIDLGDYQALMRQWFGDAVAVEARLNPVHALERGEMSVPDFEVRLAAASASAPAATIEAEGLLGRMFGTSSTRRR